MKNEIIAGIKESNPKVLETLYRKNKVLFKKEFGFVYPDIERNGLADFWKERLPYDNEEINWGSGNGLLFVIIAALVAGFIAKIPAIFSINEEFFYPRNIGFIVFPALTAFFAWRNKLPVSKIAFITIATLTGLIFINSLPDSEKSDTLTLSCLHLLLFLWSVLGFAFVGNTPGSLEKRLSYLRYNGDLIVITALIVISGGLLTGISIGLFQLIGISIEEFYVENILVFAAPAAPFLGTFLTQTNPHLVGKISPVIARIFSPLVLVMLIIYLAAILYSGKNPYNDRDFLLIFNALLIGVMAIIFFSVAETSTTNKTRAETWVLLLLSAVTIVVNGIALSAILFRISEWGITPNRAAVLGGNVLILINLLLVTIQLYRVVSKKGDVTAVGKTIAAYLPVYCIWTIIVTFLFPFIFGFK